MSQRRPDVTTGLMKFYSQAEVVKYMKDVAEYYQKEAERYGDKLGGMLRTGPAEGAPKAEKKPDKNDKKGDQKPKGPGGGWTKMGTLLLSRSDAGPAMTEVMYQIHEELKQKLARVNDAMKSFEQNASTLIPQNATFELYVRNGVPERLLVGAESAKKEAFNFDGKFRVV